MSPVDVGAGGSIVGTDLCFRLGVAMDEALQHRWLCAANDSGGNLTGLVVLDPGNDDLANAAPSTAGTAVRTILPDDAFNSLAGRFVVREHPDQLAEGKSWSAGFSECLLCYGSLLRCFEIYGTLLCRSRKNGTLSIAPQGSCR